ncbi:DNA/RNA nuclease SfsA [Hyphococcus sp.]|uniref:DNA/RNA nuclease SfsA n=1 Tax=Hyphococcus sp. TaxID=2038636 RepID=UPI003CCBAF1C
MNFPSPLRSGRLLRRYKRFLADILLDDGREVTAHCANPGSMLGVATEHARVWVWEHNNPKRKLGFSWELVEIGRTLIPINTTNPNRIVADALNANAIPELFGYDKITREVRYGSGSRIDFLLSGGEKQKPCYVEVKNVHLSRAPGLAEFPDSVTARGTRHLQELEKVKAAGARAVMLFVVQRSDCTRFSPAADLDPAYANALQTAVSSGVEVLCYDCEVSLGAVTLRQPLALILD